jgi:NAD-dependent DNA ligase
VSRPEDNPADDQYERDLLLAEIERLRAAIRRWSEAYQWLDAKFISVEYDESCRELMKIAREGR